VAARGTLRAILAAYLRRAPGSLNLAADANGKPFLQNGDGPAPLRFNLAHADDVALVAVGWHREVGVDIEREAPEPGRPRGRAPALCRRRSRGRSPTMPMPLRCRAFFALWTAREAYAKAVSGAGLEAMPDTPPTRLDGAPPGSSGRVTRRRVAVERGAEAVRCWRWQEPSTAHVPS